MNNKAIIGIYALIIASLFMGEINTAQAFGFDLNSNNKKTDIQTPNPDPNPVPLPRPVQCGDNFKDISEECDGTDFGGLTCSSKGFTSGSLSCSATCTIETNQCTGTSTNPPSTTGGGGGSSNALTIEGAKVESLNIPSAVIAWFTNKPATSQVIYDTVSHTPQAGLPNYGYALFSSISADIDSIHSVTLSNLEPNTMYYWRPVSNLNGEQVVGGELTFIATVPETTAPENPTTPTETPTTPTTPEENPSTPVEEETSPTPTPSTPTNTDTTNTGSVQISSPRVLGVATTSDTDTAPDDSETAGSELTSTTTDTVTNDTGAVRNFLILLLVAALLAGIWMYTRSNSVSDAPKDPLAGAAGKKDEAETDETINDINQ